MEKDDEIKGSGNSYTTLFRQYDARLGRWLSLDPEMSRFASESPYNFVFNNPINSTDILGDCPDGDCKEIPKDVDGANDYEQSDYWLNTATNGMDGIGEINALTEIEQNVVGNWDENNKNLWNETTTITTHTIKMNIYGKILSEYKIQKSFTESYEKSTHLQAKFITGSKSMEVLKLINKTQGSSTVLSNERSQDLEEVISLQQRYALHVNKISAIYPTANFSRNIANSSYNFHQRQYSVAAGNPDYSTILQGIELGLSRNSYNRTFTVNDYKNKKFGFGRGSRIFYNYNLPKIRLDILK